MSEPRTLPPPTKAAATVCAECPWRRASAPGWLGGRITADGWIQIALSDQAVPCHTRDGIHCKGLSIFRRNIGKLPRDASIPTSEPDRERIFAMPSEFLEHHKLPELRERKRRAKRGKK